jgi:hypothetical protein
MVIAATIILIRLMPLASESVAQYTNRTRLCECFVLFLFVVAG